MTIKTILSENNERAERLDKLYPKASNQKPLIGLALGGGGGRGWAHIGIIRKLEQLGLKPHIVTGTSIGAVVAGCYLAGKLDYLQEWACRLNTFRILRFLDFRISGGGVIGGNKLIEELSRHLGEINIEDLPHRFGSIATDLYTGQEIWATKGRLTDAMHASFAIPGIFKPVPFGDTVLVDGALVNPIPINIARALGADIVIAVNLNGNFRNKRQRASGLAQERKPPPRAVDKIKYITRRRINAFARPTDESPSVLNTLLAAGNLMQERIARINMAENPPDVLIGPRVDHVGILEFDRAEELINIGITAVGRATHTIEDALTLESR